MRSVGDIMVVGLKDGFKMFGISIMTCCAVTVCNMFVNYYLDLTAVENLVTGEYARAFYDAQLMNSKVVCSVSGGCLLATTVIMLFFYIGHYINRHGMEIGILKALGYSNIKIAKGFSVFGASVFSGCIAGYLLSFSLMPKFYELQNEEGLLPDISPNFHLSLFLWMVIAPAVFFGLIAVGHSLIKLKQPCVNLLKGIARTKGKNRNVKDKKNFISDMRSSVLRSRKTLVFFIAFSSFCFGTMIQMSSRMRELSSDMMGIMIFIIGIALAFTTLYIALTAVIKSNLKNITMMRIFGYNAGECKRSVLDGYRPAAYTGFLIGSVYQYILLKIMVEIVFSEIEGIPAEFNFDFTVFFIVLLSFIVIYEGIMLIYGSGMRKIPLKQIMSE